MTKIELFIPGEPMTAGSKIAGISKTGRRFCRPDGKFTRAWMDTVRKFASDQYKGPLLTGPISLSVIFQFVRPKSHYGTGNNKNIIRKSAPKYPGGKDIDKLERALGDGLTGIVWRNDNQVYRHFEPFLKTYGDRAGVHVTIIED